MEDKGLNSIVKIEYQAFVLTLRADGIMHVHIKAVDEFSSNDVKEILEGSKKIGKGKKFPTMFTFEKFIIIDAEARKFASTEMAGQYSLADAIITNSIALKLIANFYIAFDKPKRPTRLFYSEKEAIVWLKTFL